MHSRTIVTGLVVLGALAGCRNYQESRSKETARAAETADPRKADIRDVDMGRSVDVYGAILDKTKSFRPMDTVYASVDLKGLVPGATVVATWKDSAGVVVQKDVFAVEHGGTNRTHFALSKSEGLKPGAYTVEITVTGGDTSLQRFSVKEQPARKMPPSSTSPAPATPSAVPPMPDEAMRGMPKADDLDR